MRQDLQAGLGLLREGACIMSAPSSGSQTLIPSL